MGALTPVGHNVAETWNNLVNGVSGVDTITSFDTSALSAKIAAQIKDFHPEEHFDLKEARKMDSFTHFAMVAAREAVKDAGIDSARQDGRRVGVITGVGIGGIYTFEEETIKNHLQGPRRISPFFIPKMISNIAAAHIAIEHGFKGPNFSIASACASANHAIGTAFRAIQYGDADIIISGGAEAGVTALSVGGFCALRALSTRNDDPKGASRPFDAGRDGFVMSEGAAFLVLEELEHAKARGATIYAELAGYAATDDAFHITAPLDDGSGSAEAMLGAIADAGISPADIQYVNAHGTSTPKGDRTEIKCLREVFGKLMEKIPVSSNKSQLGHTLGATAAIEAALTIEGMRQGILLPTINHLPDPEFADIDVVPNAARRQKYEIALSNAFGFGGTNCCVIFRGV